MMFMKSSIKIVILLAPGSGVETDGHGQYGHSVKMHLILETLELRIPPTLGPSPQELIFAITKAGVTVKGSRICVKTPT